MTKEHCGSLDSKILRRHGVDLDWAFLYSSETHIILININMQEEKYLIKNPENDAKSCVPNSKMFCKVKTECGEVDDVSTQHRDTPSNPETHGLAEEYLEAPLPLSKLESAPCEMLSPQQAANKFRSFKLYFKTQNSLSFGKSIYVVGSCPELGDWKLEYGMRLEWAKGDLWRGSANVTTNEDIQYKYVIANFQFPNNGEAQWESGCNRRIVLAETVGTNQILLSEKWNYQKITLKIREDYADQMSIIGNGLELGIWASKRLMKCESNGNGQKLWTTSFSLQKSKEYLRYYYVREIGEECVREKEPGRYLFMASNMESECNLQGRQYISRKPGEVLVMDLNDFESFKIAEITDEIVVGPYVHCAREVEELANRNVKAVLSLQSHEDMKKYKIDWRIVCQMYREKGIQAINIEVIDMKARDFLLKSPLALCILDRLITNHGKTYVHCTAGIYRSPQLIALFLIKHRNYSLEETLEIFKNKRPFAKPIPSLIKMCLAHVETEPQKTRKRAHTLNI